MRILHVIASNFVGGPEKQILHHAMAMRSGDYEIIVGSFHDGAERPEILTAAEAAGLETVCLSGGLTLQSIRELRDALAARRIDLLCTHGYKANIIGYLATRRLATAQVGFVRGWTAETWRIKLFERLDRMVLARTEEVVCVSAQQARQVARTRKQRSSPRVIRNASLPSARKSVVTVSRETLGIPLSSFVFGAAGRFSAEKGHSYLLSALTRVREQHPDVPMELLLLGEGREEPALRRQAEELEMTAVVRFAGFQRDCAAYMSLFDCLVQPSLTEGTPNSVLEAMQLGIPVVATAVGGVPDLIQDGENGLLVPACNIDALAGAMERVLTHPLLRARLAGAAQQMQGEFHPEMQQSKLVSLYEFARQTYVESSAR